MAKKIIDLSHLINEAMPVYPGTPVPKLERCNTIENDGFNEHRLNLSSHTGTHMDAPCHILPNAKSLDDFPVEKFMGKAVVIPCEGLDEISLEDLEEFESMIREADFVLFRTGWSGKWGIPAYFDGFPALTPEAAKWLTGFNLKGLGFDAISADFMDSFDLPVHHILLEKEILLIENLNNLELLPRTPFEFICLPLKVEKADGSPVRAVAVIED